MSTQVAERRVPVALAPKASIRKLTHILRAPARRAPTRSLTVGAPPSPALSSFSLDNDYMMNPPRETERADVRPLFCASEGHGGEMNFSGSKSSRGAPRKYRRASVDLADTRVVNRGSRGRSRVLDDVDPDWKWGQQTKLRPLSPPEWAGHARSASVGTETTFVGSENRTPPDSPPSPSTPRPHSVMHRPYSKPGGDSDNSTPSPTRTFSEITDAGPLTKFSRRPRSASDPHSYPGTAFRVPSHAGTDSSSTTEYLTKVREQEKPLSPPPRRTPMPEDVYFTAAGRRESRIYIPPRMAPPLSPMRGHHTHSSSDSIFQPSNHHAAWTKQTSRPFEDVVSRVSTTPVDGDNTPVCRREELWSGEWNRDNIQEVIQELRSLK